MTGKLCCLAAASSTCRGSSGHPVRPRSSATLLVPAVMLPFSSHPVSAVVLLFSSQRDMLLRSSLLLVLSVLRCNLSICSLHASY
ncbi:unnamed protein product [Nippostrongylus brasiliensis]|uniref:Secreted protein n=1 Tax=Nippostrongylus brasiliensis TaxID=27835 RepID=A0A0N4YB27_NIPBR|nr:hypothetical protein Q1695_015472 [Nippostrongylus brasiliensis]VDL77229.1 unnamed protein product [Nippostrongylus brasiliensis]